MPYASWRVLCVDDHEDSLELNKIVLEEGGFAVVTAGTFAEGQRLIEAERFDAFVIDGHLPDGDGLDLCQKIRNSRPEAPIVVLSASVDDDHVQRAFGHGATAHLGKPLGLESLCEKIKELHRRAIEALNLAVRVS